MATSSIIASLREEDAKLNHALRYVVGIPHDVKGAIIGPASYAHLQDPELLEKMNYGEMLSGQTPQPVVNVTQEDVNIMNEKAWMGRLMDFNNWVGKTYSPADNPASKELLSRIYPEWIQMQQDEISNWHEMKKRIETIRLKGAENKEDLWMLYQLTHADPANFGRAMETANAPGLRTGGGGWAAEGARNFKRGVWNTRKTEMTAGGMKHVMKDEKPDTPMTGLRGLDFGKRFSANWKEMGTSQ